MGDGKPPPRCGNIFLAVHQGSTRNDSLRNLDEYFDWSLTLTMRVSMPPDKVGSQELANRLARVSGPRSPSFNARCEQLRAWGNMNWAMTVVTGGAVASANDNIASWSYGTSVYGFVEPAHFAGMELPTFVYGQWFDSNPEAPDVGIKSELRFVGARRLQPQTLAVGPFV